MVSSVTTTTTFFVISNVHNLIKKQWGNIFSGLKLIQKSSNQPIQVVGTNGKVINVDLDDIEVDKLVLILKQQHGINALRSRYGYLRALVINCCIKLFLGFRLRKSNFYHDVFIKKL